ncbi:hypothetical protein GCM10023144_32080 [Pigmentiphaga soli]|uniref:Thiol:disulfide interchange protein DsbD n=1 Tax=Pigmentiphaga soli TaxID=1007095 RepID=A0ABP8HBC4_9BURK
MKSARIESQNACRWLAWLLAAWLAAACLALPRAGHAADPDFLPPEQAFHFEAHAVGPDMVELNWRIAPGYYMYREQFRFATEPAGIELGEPAIPPGHVKFDQTFQKEVETYRDTVAIRIPVPAGAPAFALIATGQGCADAGLCYPPTQYRARIVPASAAGGELRVDSGAGGWTGLFKADDVGLADMLSGGSVAQTVLVFFALGILLSLTPCVLPMVPILSAIVAGDTSAAARPRLRGLGLAALYVAGMSVVYTVAGVLAGLSGVSLAASLQTPWVLGLFAALLAVLALAMFDVFTLQLPASWQGALSARAARLPGGRAAGALGMGAVSALIVGPCVAAPLAGALLYISQTGDVALGALALFALAWGMGVPLLAAGASAGALLPKAGPWMDGVKRFFGMLLFAVAWWMLAPVLPGWVQMAGWAALAVVAAALLRAFDSLPGDARPGRLVLKGFGMLLALAGVLQAVGLASGGDDPLQPLAHLAPGGRMDGLAEAGGAPSGGAAEAASPWQADAGAPPPAMSAAPAAADLAARFGGPQPAGGIDMPPGAPGSPPLIGAPAASNPLGAPGESSAPGMPGNAGPASAPSARAPTDGRPVFQRIRTVAELDALLAASDRPVMLDFYADWCVSCKEMERLTFPRPEVAQRLARLRLVQADVTANNADDRALLKRFRLFGPPGIVFFEPGGRPIAGARVIGYQGPARFAETLDKVLVGG